MYWEKKERLTIGGFPSIEVMAPGLDVRFAARQGGSSSAPFDSLNLGSGIGDDEDSVACNRKLLYSTLGLNEDRVALCRQIHGDDIEVIDKGGVYEACDGLITDSPGISLVISTADCYPVVIYSPPERVLAMLHAGREGARKGIIGRAIGIMKETFDVEPSTLVAGTGPGICARCYEVSEDIAGAFPVDTVRRIEGRYHLDILAYCEKDLTGAGVRADRIFRANLCTACEERLCYSYRRDGGRTGRHWTIATIMG